MPFGKPRTAHDELTVITLCGSMRFRDEFERLNAELTLAGHVVLTPTVLAPSTELSVEERARLGRVHLAKVAMADEVLVVNVGGYVGESTRREIEHARSHGVAVSFLEPHTADDHPARSSLHPLGTPSRRSGMDAQVTELVRVDDQVECGDAAVDHGEAEH